MSDSIETGSDPYLLARLQQRAVRADATFRLSRRAFIAGLGLASPAAASAIGTAFSSEPRLKWRSSTLVLIFAGSEWVLDKLAFGASARLSAVKTSDRIMIRLAGACLPGTDLRADLNCEIVRSQGGWRARIAMPSLGIRAECSLAHWVRGGTVVGHGVGVDLRAGRSRLRVASGKRALSSKFGLSVMVEGRTSFDGSCKCAGDGASLALHAPSLDPLMATDGPLGWSTRFDIVKPRLSRRAFACGTSDNLATVCPNEADRVAGQLFGPTSHTRELLVIEGPARLELRDRGGPRTGLRLSYAVVGLSDGRLAVAGDLGGDRQLIDAGRAALLISGIAAHPFEAVFRRGDQPAFAARVQASQLWAPSPDTNGAQINLGNETFEVGASGANRPWFKRAYPQEDEILNDSASIVDGGVDRFDLNIDRPIRLRRADNLLDLTFQFPAGFRLVRMPGTSYVHKLERTKRSGWLDPGLIIVTIGPQHQAETVISWDVAPGACPPPAKPARSRFSGQSQLVFMLEQVRDTGRALWQERELSVDQLTDWRGLKMVVDRRAQSSVVDDLLDSQLAVLGVSLHGPDGDLRGLEEILKVIGTTFDRPRSPDEAVSPIATSLELVDDLAFSPSEKTVWERSRLTTTPNPSLKGSTRIPLFAMRFGRGDDRIIAERDGQDPRLRALWSYRSDAFKAGKLPLQVLEANAPPELSALTDDNHWEIIGQTSIYGLPALRRLTDAEANQQGAQPSNQPSSVDQSAKRVPRGGVVRPVLDPTKPDKTLAYLREVDLAIAREDPTFPPNGTPAPESGIALATAFQRADVTMTPLGAIMRLDWSGEPAILKPNGKVPKGFSLERFAYETWLGRDVRVIAVTKGFLVPFGNRASLIMTAERVFLKGADGKPVSQEIRREFIVTPRTPKGFPAVNQPDKGRDFPASSVAIISDRTPDLVPHVDVAGGLIPSDRGWIAFWPRIRTADGRIVDFEWKSSIDGDPTPLVNRMIFVEADALGQDPDFVAELVRNYNDSGENRRAHLGGTRRPYAQRDTAPGKVATSGVEPDTAFDTDNWMLQARGRRLPSGADSFVMDARMNGADQPPFYPSLERAAISVQSIDRLVGEPQGLITVRPYKPFVTQGFTDAIGGAQNEAAEIFLEILGPEIKLAVAGKQPSTGGLAQPDTIAAALSRKIGVVGGQRQNARPLQAITADDPSPYNFASAANGDFNPAQFFDIKIFGVQLTALVPESGIENAPKLTEVLDLGVQGTQALDAVRKTANEAARQLTDMASRIKTAIDEADRQIKPLSIDKAYPDLIFIYNRDFPAILQTIRDIGAATTLQAVVGPAQRLAKLSAPLLKEIGAVLRDPVPPLVSSAIDTVLGRWVSVEAQVRLLIGNLGATLAAEIRKQLLSAADDIAPLFGLADGAALHALLRSPDAQARLLDGLFYTQLSGPLLEVIGTLFEFADEIAGRLVLAIADVRRTAVTALSEALQDYAAELAPNSTAMHDVLRPDDAEALAAALANAVTVAIAALVPDGLAPEEALRSFEDAIGKGRLAARVRDKVRAEIEARRDWFNIPGANGNATFAAIADKIANELKDDAEQAATSQIVRVRKRVETLLNNQVDALLTWASEEVQAIANAASALLRTADVAAAGQGLSNWCNDLTTGPRALAVILGDTLFGLEANIDQELTSLRQVLVQLQALTPPSEMPPAIVARFNDARTVVARAIDILKDASVRLAQARQQIATAAQVDICGSFAQMGAAFAAMLDARADMLRGVLSLGNAVSRLFNIANGNPALTAAGTFPTDLKAIVGDISSDAGRLLRDISWIGDVVANGDWASVKTGVARLAKDLKDQAAYVAELSNLPGMIEAKVGEVQRKLADLQAHPEHLEDVVDTVIRLANLEQTLSSYILQTAALGKSGIDKLTQVAVDILKAVGTALNKPHEAALQALQTLVNASGDPVFKYFFADFKAFSDNVALAVTDQKMIATLAMSTDDAAVRGAARFLIEEWHDKKKLPLFEAGLALARMLDQILQGKFGPLVVEALREAFGSVQDWVKRLISSLVPTSITTGYDWSTKLEDKVDVFRMIKPADYQKNGIDPKDIGSDFVNDLTIKTQIKCDFVSKERSVVSSGFLKPFKIGLPKAEEPTFFAIAFKSAVFKSINGQSPYFRADIANVIIGSSLQFLQKLQELMAPGENGIYVEPSFNAIQVGYRLAVGLREVGSLQLINLAFDVYAKLPFDDAPAEFGFLFASAERPFLISNPPYGGGGWVSIVAYADNRDIALSLMFGAVTAISFGPLTGQGRICAGISFDSKSQLLTAFVEAVGEGNIACFSIGIFIRISLTHYPSGAMVGVASYRFTFKIGFVSVSYGVQARYAVNGGSGAAARSAGAMGAVEWAASILTPALARGASGPTHESAVPAKSVKWNEYQKYVAMELLDG